MGNYSSEDTYRQCVGLMNKQEVIDFLAELIKVNSSNPPGNEKDVALIVGKKFEEYGFSPQIDDLEGVNRANLIAKLSGAEPRPNLVYSGHLDVVPATKQNWEHDPFGAEIEGDLMYGRGTSDMKAGDAAMIMAMCLLKKAGVKLNGTLTFVNTASEEVDCYGSKAYVKKYGVDDIDALAISEASERRVYVAEKGAFWLKFTSYGKTAHGGLPKEGINALLHMLKFFETFRHYEFQVQEHPLLGSPSMSITTMHAGRNTNVLPEKCEATVDIRTVPGISHDKVMADIHEILDKMRKEDETCRIDVEPLNNYPPIETSMDDEFTKVAFNTYKQVFGKEIGPAGVYYYTDGVSFEKEKYIPMIIYGPGDPSRSHKPNEYVEISQVIDSVKYYIALAINYLK